MFHTWKKHNLPVDNISLFETSEVYPCISSRDWRTNEAVRIAVERTAGMPKGTLGLPEVSYEAEGATEGKKADVIRLFDTK